MISFAHRGAPRSRQEENTLPAFERALSFGATGIESDIALTADGVPVLYHPRPLSRHRIGHRCRADLPPQVPSLADVYEHCGTEFHLSLDMGAPAAAEAVVATADRFGARDRLWLTYWHVSTLAAWRERWPHLRLVYPTIPLSPRRIDRLLTRLREQRVDVLNVHRRFCTPALAARAHNFGLQVFVWGVRRHDQAPRVVRAGVDGVFCDDLETLLALCSG